MTSLTREEIYELVWREPLTEIAKKYQISDVGFRKLCVRMNIPTPIAGYWAKVYAGQRTSRPPLPKKFKGKDVAELKERPPEVPVKKKESELQLLGKMIAREKLPFKVPERLANPLPATVAARKSLANLTNTYHPGMALTAKGELDIRVAPVNTGRALRFMDTLVKCIRARGHRYEIAQDGNYVGIREIRLKVSFRERTKKVVINDQPYANFEWRPNGVVLFRLEGRLKAEWQDTKTSLLEEQLPRILAKLELVAKSEEAYLENARVWQENWEKERREQAEREKMHREELQRFKKLIADVKLWKQAQAIREYLSASASTDPQWSDWVGQKADWLDPLAAWEDKWLTEADKKVLDL